MLGRYKALPATLFVVRPAVATEAGQQGEHDEICDAGEDHNVKVCDRSLRVTLRPVARLPRRQTLRHTGHVGGDLLVVVLLLLLLCDVLAAVLAKNESDGAGVAAELRQHGGDEGVLPSQHRHSRPQMPHLPPLAL